MNAPTPKPGGDQESGKIVATARVVLERPQACLDALAAHFVEHAQVTPRPGGIRIDAGFAQADITVDHLGIDIVLLAIDEPSFAHAKLSLAEHLAEFASKEVTSIRWSDAGSGKATPDFFRAMIVEEVRNITPSMRRVTLSGLNLGRFAEQGLHVRMLFPPEPGARIVSPLMGADGKPHWAEAEDRPFSRVYTLRNVDVAAGRIEIDMLLHIEAHGPGSDWALRAAPGASVGIMGPRGSALPEAERYILLGDETALPAIARHLATLPETSMATVLLDVADAREEQSLASPARLNVHWLHRNATNTRAGDNLVVALRDPAITETLGQSFVWAGCERQAADAIRNHLRKEHDHAPSMHRVAAYWQRNGAQS